MDKNRPARVLRDGNLKATIWANRNDNGLYFTTSLAKTYTDAQHNVRDTGNFHSADLLRIAELSRLAHHAVNELRAEFKRSNGAAGRQATAQNQGALPYRETAADQPAGKSGRFFEDADVQGGHQGAGSVDPALR
ncbi:MAG: hypothetical protein AAFX08_02870 [Pseudomonadota bacterium]